MSTDQPARCPGEPLSDEEFRRIADLYEGPFDDGTARVGPYETTHHAFVAGYMRALNDMFPPVEA